MVLHAGCLMMNDFVQIEKLCKSFDLSDPLLARIIYRRSRRFLKAVDKISFNIKRGQTYALVGESGSGKSTIARMIVGLLLPSSGRVLIDAQRVGAAATQKSYSAQLTAHFALAHLNSCVALVCDSIRNARDQSRF